ncbi:MAG: ornithine cyclodeaminase family protein [Alphaproteobacteria bacterium]|nr:ornithine cyclodeaminase family protein [Alphaproteobacteria bacterium]
MRLVSAEEVHRTLDYPALVEALRSMFRAGCEAPPRHHHAIASTVAGGAGNTLLLMPAWQPGAALGVKIVTVFPDNGQRALPAVFGTYLLLDPMTGAPSAVLDGTALTVRRTAAASALAADYLARADSTVHLIVGTGALAPHLCATHAAIRPIRSTLIWGRDTAKAAALADRLRLAGLAAEPVGDLAGAVAMADIVSCATLAREPLIDGAWLRPGTHVDLVGGYTPEMREANDAAIARATVYIDTEAASREAGDIVVPLRQGVLDRARIAGDLFGLCRGDVPGRRNSDEVTLFKSVGHALEDLAAAQLVLRRLDEHRG